MYLLPIVPDHVPGMDDTASKLYLLKLYMDMVAKKGKKEKKWRQTTWFKMWMYRYKVSEAAAL